MTQRMTTTEYRAMLASQPTEKKRSKYNNTRHQLEDGTRADSTKEAWRLKELRIKQVRGEIRNLKPEKGGKKAVYSLIVNGLLICKYEPDAVYEERQPDGSWLFVVEDTKSTITANIRLYQVKKSLMKAIHNIEIREV